MKRGLKPSGFGGIFSEEVSAFALSDLAAGSSGAGSFAGAGLVTPGLKRGLKPNGFSVAGVSALTGNSDWASGD